MAGKPNIALRPMLPDEGPLLAALFQLSIEELAADDYDDAQREAWASVTDDEDAFAAHLASMLTIVATVDGEPAGFASLEGADHFDMLYVHPAAAGMGVATTLADAIEKLAAARKADRLTVEASDTALPFFERRGYVAERRDTVLRAGEWIGRTIMSKSLVAAGDDPHHPPRPFGTRPS